MDYMEQQKYSLSGLRFVFEKKCHCDILRINDTPLINVSIKEFILFDGVNKVLLNEYPTDFDIEEIYFVVPLIPERVTEASLSAIDVREANEVIGENGETLKQLIIEGYQVSTPAEVEWAIKRYLSSLK